MNVNAFDLNIQYQKTQLSYDMTISKVDPSQTSQDLLEESSELGNLNLPVVYMSTEDLNNQEVFSKMLLEATYSQYSQNSSSVSLFPNMQTTNEEEIPQEIKAYSQPQGLPEGLLYTSSSEYYEKTTIDFKGEIRIVTPEGEYSIELNLSYSQEFYEKNATFVEVAQQKLQTPLELELSEDNESLKDLSSIDLMFDNIYEETNSNNKQDFFEKLLASLEQREEYMEAILEKSKENEEQMDNYQVFMSTNKEEYQLISAQKDGFAIFFSQTQSESSSLSIEANEKGTTISSSYSSSQSTSISTFEDIKV